jgi:hypothetical protein
MVKIQQNHALRGSFNAQGGAHSNSVLHDSVSVAAAESVVEY